MFSNLFLSISAHPRAPLLVSPLPLPSISPISPRCSPCWVTVSSHSINQACEGSRAQCSITSHSPSLLPSVPVTLPSLSQSLGKRKACAARYGLSPPRRRTLGLPPPPYAHCRSGDGQDAAGVPDSAHLITLDNLPLPSPSPFKTQHRSLGV